MSTLSHANGWNFAERTSVEQVEEGNVLAPKFAADGTLPCFTRHFETGEVLMAAFMNADALRLTIDTKLAHYWSRSRQKLWKKGETSGMHQQVQRILIDGILLFQIAVLFVEIYLSYSFLVILVNPSF